MVAHDKYGTELKPGDTILYPMWGNWPPPIPPATIVQLVVIAIDSWDFDEAWRTKFGPVPPTVEPQGFRVVAAYANDFLIVPESEILNTFVLPNPEESIVVTGVELCKRHKSPPADRKGYWTKPGGKGNKS